MPKPNDYPNLPRVAVGAIVFHKSHVLLVQRGQQPAYGQWAIPGGRVQLGESLQAAAEREILEETGVTVRAGEVVFTFDSIVHDAVGRVQFHYVILDLMARYVSGTPRAADDALDARWISAPDLAALDVNPTTRKLLAEQFNFGC